MTSAAALDQIRSSRKIEIDYAPLAQESDASDIS